MMAHLYKRGKVWQGKIKLDGWLDMKRFSLGTTDKRIASLELEKRLRDFEHVEKGLLAPLTARQAAKQPLLALCETFLNAIEINVSKGTRKKYSSALRAVQKETGWATLAHVTEKALRDWQRHATLRAETSNDYLAVWGRFFRWLKRQRLVLENPCDFIDPVDVHKTAREYRRALTAEEVERLLTVAPPTRRLVYRIIFETGLRRAEIKNLRVGDFIVKNVPPASHTRGPGEVCRAGSPEKKCGETGGTGSQGDSGSGGPCVRVPASIAKNRKSVLLPLGELTAAEVLAFIGPDAPSFACPFAAKVPRGSTIRRDLAAAGIPFLDTLGRRADLHAMRKSFGTALVLSGAQPRVVMEAMRQSDYKLTMKTYMDAAHLQGPVARAVALLPWHRETGASKSEIA